MLTMLPFELLPHKYIYHKQEGWEPELLESISEALLGQDVVNLFTHNR